MITLYDGDMPMNSVTRLNITTIAGFETATTALYICYNKGKTAVMMAMTAVTTKTMAIMSTSTDLQWPLMPFPANLTHGLQPFKSSDSEATRRIRCPVIKHSFYARHIPNSC